MTFIVSRGYCNRKCTVCSAASLAIFGLFVCYFLTLYSRAYDTIVVCLVCRSVTNVYGLGQWRI